MTELKVNKQKPINIWLYIILSLIPFVGYYPFLKIKKTRRILLLNIPIAIGIFTILLFVNHILGQILSYTVIPTIDAIFLYNWIKGYNKKVITKPDNY